MRPYHKLRTELYIGGITAPLLARRLRIGTATVSRKLNAKSPWTLSECYQVMDLLGKPYEQIPVTGETRNPYAVADGSPAAAG